MRRFRKTDRVDELYAFVTGEGIIDAFKVIRMPREEVANTGDETLEGAGLTSMESLHVELTSAPAAPTAPSAAAASSLAIAPSVPHVPPVVSAPPVAPVLSQAKGNQAKGKRKMPEAEHGGYDDDVIDITSPAFTKQTKPAKAMRRSADSPIEIE
jgi:hypothetical protein